MTLLRFLAAVAPVLVACRGAQRPPAPGCPACPTQAPVTLGVVPDLGADLVTRAPPIRIGGIPGGTIKLTILPAPAYVERSDGAQLVNCDLRLDNGTGLDWELTAIEVSVYDRAGALAWRKRIDSNGVSPGIKTIPDRTLVEGAQALVLNPVHTFPVDLDLARLRFALTFDKPDDKVVSSDEEQRDPLTITAEVAPTPYVTHARLRLPVAGRVLVWDGHDFLSHHRRWDYVFEPIRTLGFDSNAGRYAYDLVPVDAQGAMHVGAEADNASWAGFGQPVLAPAAGTVVAIVTGEPDNRSFDFFGLAQNLLLPYGNHILIDHGHGEISMLAHLRQASVTVAVGATVTAGQPIAQIGASGSALFPHLHYQLQDAAHGHAEGVPSYFHDFARVRGARRTPVKRGAIDSGDLVDSAAPTPAGKRGR